MSTAKRKEKAMKPPRIARVSITFPSELYETLEQIAKQKKVSVAWVVRDAADRYVSDQWPLLDRSNG